MTKIFKWGLKTLTMAKISVIVCTKNEEKNIGKCLQCLIKQTIKPEIIIVDGHSKDKTRKIAERYADKILLDDKKGLGDARNVGWKNASAKIVAYCDTDVRPKSHWCERILKEFESDKKLVAVSGPLVPYDGEKSLKQHFKFWAGDFPLAVNPVFPNIWGANMAFKKFILRKFPFKEKFLEDYDIRNRLLEAGYKIKFSANVSAPASTRRFQTTLDFYETCWQNYIIYSVNKSLTGKSGTGYYSEE